MLLRLMTSKSSLSRKELGKQYERQREVGNRLRKFTPEYSKKLSKAQQVPSFLQERSFHASRMNTSREELKSQSHIHKERSYSYNRNANHIPKLPNCSQNSSKLAQQRLQGPIRNTTKGKSNSARPIVNNKRNITPSNRNIASNINSYKFNHMI